MLFRRLQTYFRHFQSHRISFTVSHADRRWTTVHFWLGSHDETLEDQGTGRAAFLCKSYWRAVFLGRNLETSMRHLWDIYDTSMRHLWDIYETSMRHLWDIRHLKTFEAKEIPESCCFQTRDSGDIEPIELISQMPQTPKVPQWGESNLLHPKKSEKC